MKKEKFVVYGIGAALIVVALIAIAKLQADKPVKPAENLPPAQPVFTVDSRTFSFGEISMKDGLVNHVFSLVNKTEQPVTIKKIYTSCMCTTAVLKQGDQSWGPYGMPGHGFMPAVNKTVRPGEELSLEVIYDPNAHGPAGVGYVERLVYLATDKGLDLLKITATVTP